MDTNKHEGFRREGRSRFGVRRPDDAFTHEAFLVRFGATDSSSLTIRLRFFGVRRQ
jgi:hypothetical protein